MFMALSADTQPHFTTIAHFVFSMHDEIVPLFRNILLYCAEEGLISRKNEDKEGRTGLKKSNITDNESAKMPNSHGMVQGYNAAAAVAASFMRAGKQNAAFVKSGRNVCAVREASFVKLRFLIKQPWVQQDRLPNK